MVTVLATLLAVLPVFAVGLAVARGLRATGAAVAGLLAVAVAVAAHYPLDLAVTRAHLLHWAPLMVEIMLIIGGGLLLAATTAGTGSQRVLASRMAGAAGTQVATVLLVVHGITPFAESVMGFGVGAMLGLPILLHVGIAPTRAVVVTLLGLSAVPWGAMAPGILVASGMTGLSFRDLGVASGRLSLVPFIACGIAAILVAFGRQARAGSFVAAIFTGALFCAGVTGANIVAGTPPAGALGALLVIVAILLWQNAARLMRRAPRPLASAHDTEAGPSLQRAVVPYVVVLGGVLLATWATRGLPQGSPWHYLASPGLWLFVSCTSEYALHRRELAPATLARVCGSAWHSWRAVGPATASFVLLGVLMVDAGMTGQIATAAASLGPVYVVLAPALAAVGGFLTGSNAGAMAMFAAPQAQVAQALGQPVLDVIAMANVAASLLTMASPGRVMLAVRMCPPGSVSMRETTARLLLIDAVIIAALGLISLTL